MQEILPGIHHWSTFHPPIRARVSSYYVEPAGLVIDPKIPDGGLEALPGRPSQIALTIGLHHRDAPAFAEAFGARVRAPREAEHRLRGRLEFDGFGDGEEIAPSVTAVRVGHLAPDEYALHIAVGEGAVSFADGLMHDGELRFVSDGLMGDDPEAVKRGLRDAFAELLERDFDHLLFAHGTPVVGGGKAALEAFLDRAG